MREAEFQIQVVTLAQYCGYRHYHTFDSRRSSPGFPDLVFVRTHPPDFLIVELKSDTGRVSADQAAWIADLKAAGVDAYIWRPKYWSEIEARLSRRDRNG